ncbi:tetratricopeptide repeat protein [Paraburkholderia sediminicola]|uniref:tetratricopeptide repeat protein n=1 Tax=Paraburkholderia sediminicola TaxID=458836 RepID=UPI0038BB4422
MNERPDFFMSHPLKIAISATNEGLTPPPAASQTAVDAMFRSALSAHREGRVADAYEGYRRVLARDTSHADATYLIGVIEQKQGRQTETEGAYRRALQLQPDFAENLIGIGILFSQIKWIAEAETAFHRALELHPDMADAYNNLGTLFAESRRFVEAEAAYCRALEINPAMASTHCNLGTLFAESRRFVEAEAAYRRVLELSPYSAEAHVNLGNLFMRTRRFVEAETAFLRALELKPDYVEVRVNLGFCLLHLGRYREAWDYYESRCHVDPKDSGITPPQFLPFPEWKGQPLANKSLVIWQEQGFGDQVQFVRYASLLKRRGASRITVVCDPVLGPLLETAEGVDAVITNPNLVPLHDYWSMFLSLPRHFGTTVESIPTPLPYVFPLRERTQRWQKKLPGDGLRVGLVWKGSAPHKNDANRSLSALSALSPLWSVPGVTFVSLQKGHDDAAPPPAEQPITALGLDIHDFADTAAIVAQLDLVICVDTAVAHVAGALAKPCWVLLPFSGTDWRWLQDRSDSPWYPKGMRLFRQSEHDSWTDVIDKVATALGNWALTHPRAKSNMAAKVLPK